MSEQFFTDMHAHGALRQRLLHIPSDSRCGTRGFRCRQSLLTRCLIVKLPPCVHRRQPDIGTPPCTGGLLRTSYSAFEVPHT